MKQYIKPLLTKDFALQAMCVSLMLSGVILALGFALHARESVVGYSYLDKAHIAHLNAQKGENS